MGIPIYFTILDNNTDSALYETFIGKNGDEIPLKDMYPFVANSSVDIIDHIQKSEINSNSSYNKSHLQQKVRNMLLSNINEPNTNNNVSFYSENILNSPQNISDAEFAYNANATTTLQQITNIPQGSLFLGTIDEHESYLVTAYVTYNNTKFVLISDQTITINYNSIKKFFLSVHELYIKQIMNPFILKNTMITNKLFDCKVRVLGDMYILPLSTIAASSSIDV